VLLAFLFGWHPTCAERPNRGARGNVRSGGELSDAEGYLIAGSRHIAAGRDEEAIACFKKAVALEPNHLEAQTTLGNCCRELGRKAEAIAAYEKVIELDPNGKWGKSAREYLAELCQE
jgi:tetratricopeptide (TPR) repeat protein